MLRWLFLQDNKLTSFLPGALKGLKHLYHLDLSNNSLMTLDEYSFDSLESLRTLNMAWNQLEALPPRVFQNQALRKLYEIDLSNNRLSCLPNGIFKDVGNDAYACHYSGYYCTHTRTVTLRLQGNMLSTLDGAFHGFVMLEKLYLQDNKLTSLLPGALKGLKHLDHLDLSNNSLMTLDEHILTVWKASGPSTWHGISWKPFHLESFKLSAA